MARVLSIRIDLEVCTCSRACVHGCPEALDGEMPDGVPRLREGAGKYFESHARQTKAAAGACPVEAIIL